MDVDKDRDSWRITADSLPDYLTESTAYGPQGAQYEPEDTIDLTATLNSVSLSSPYSYTLSSVSGTTISGPFTSGTSSPWITANPTGTSAKIHLNGEGADVEVNGWSLVAAVKRIEERLCLFQPNPELESEWEELRELAEQYKKLEQHIKDKQATFDRLKAMPAPEID